MPKQADPTKLSKWATEFLAYLQEESKEPLLVYWQANFWYWQDGIYIMIPVEVMEDKILLWLTAKGWSSSPGDAAAVTINLRAMVRASMGVEINTWLRKPSDDELDAESE